MTAHRPQQHRGRRRHRHHGPGHRPGRAGRGPSAYGSTTPRPGAPAQAADAIGAPPRPAGREGPAHRRPTGTPPAAGSAPPTALADLADAALVVEASWSDWPSNSSCSPRWRTSSPTTACSPPTPPPCPSPPSRGALRHPGRFVGLHFFNPAPLLPLVEVVSGFATDEAAATRAYETAAAWGKTPVALRRHPRLHRQPHRPALLRRGLRGLRGAGRRPRHHRRGAARVRRLPDGPLRADRPDRPGRQRGRHPLRVGGLLPGPASSRRPSPSAGWSSPACTAARRATAGTTTPTGAEPPGAAHRGAAARRPRTSAAEGDLGPRVRAARADPEAGITVTREPTRTAVRRLHRAARRRPAGARRRPDRRAEFRGRHLLRPGPGLPRRHPDRPGGLRRTPPRETLAEAVGLFQALGKQVSVIDDVPGMIVARTVAMLVDFAARRRRPRAWPPPRTSTPRCGSA